jgi:hypothetical protein
MADVTYKKDITGLLVIDPYNDFDYATLRVSTAGA